MSELPERRFWSGPLIPAVTFLAGLLIGAVVVFVGQTGDDSTGDEGSAAPSAQSTSPSPSGDTVVTVPAACREAADRLEEGIKVLRGSVDSVRNFNPGEIVRTLNRLEKLDQETRPLLRECRKVDLTISASPTPTS